MFAILSKDWLVSVVPRGLLLEDTARKRMRIKAPSTLLQINLKTVVSPWKSIGCFRPH